MIVLDPVPNHLQGNARQKHVDRIFLHNPSLDADFLLDEVFMSP